MKKFLYILSLNSLLISQYSFAQSPKTDSLATALKTAKHDTDRINILNGLIENENDAKVWQPYNLQMKNIAEKLAQSSNKLIKQKGKRSLADALNNIGFIYQNQGQIKEALNYYTGSLKIDEEIGNKQGTAYSLNNIGSIYQQQGQIKEALEYYGRSIKIQEEIGDKYGIATSLNGIGLIYNNQEQLKEALEYFGRSLTIREDIDDKPGIATALNNIGVIYNKQGQIKEALKYYIRSLKIWEDIGHVEGIAHTLNDIGRIYLNQKKYTLALVYADSSLSLARIIGYAENIRNAEGLLAKIDSARGNGAGAFEHYKQYIIYRDSISNQETRKTSIKKQMAYEYEKKEASAKAEQDKLDAITKEEKQKQQIVIYSVAGVLLLVIVFSIFLFNRFRITNRQKVIIEKQKEQVDKAYESLHEKNKEVMDSINYASRIQRALLPSVKYVENSLNRLRKSG